MLEVSCHPLCQILKLFSKFQIVRYVGWWYVQYLVLVYDEFEA
jgi:hypothetical protein